jgi:deaminated glutathione amidase
MSVEVAAVQFRAGVDVAANLKHLGDLVAAAAKRGARLVVAPEFAMYSVFDGGEQVPEVAEPLDGPFAGAICALAEETRTTLVVGMIEQTTDDAGTGPRERPFNTVITAGPDGGLIGWYRKLHLYDAFGFAESDLFRPAEHAKPLVFPLGELRFGVMTCYDLRFPEMSRVLVDAGADVLVVPAAWVAGPNKEDHWLTLLRARAIENTCFVIASAQTGPAFVGHSVVVDPIGTIVAGASEAPGLVETAISRERIAEVRRLLPSLEHRRFRVVPGSAGFHR